MKPRNISFAEVLKGKARSPQPESKTSTCTLAQMLEQWEEYPEEDYTLYLGRFGHSFKSKNSSSKMYISNNRNNEEEMFDSWIQRQSAINANKENRCSQPVRPKQSAGKAIKTPSKFLLNSKTKQAGEQDRVAKKQQKPMINFRNFQNIGGNIKMIKSNTYQNQKTSQIKNQGMTKNQSDLHLEVQEVDIAENEPVRQQRNMRNIEKEREDRHWSQCEAQEQQQEHQPQYEEEISNVKESIQELIADTTNHLHEDIADLAKQYVEEHQAQQQSRKSPPKEENEQEDELLIGDSDKKGFGKSDNLFSQDYLKKNEERSEIQRKRREEAKNKVSRILQDYMKKDKPAVNLNLEIETVEPKKIQEKGEVGYSFSGNILGNEGVQQKTNQLQITNIQQIRSQLPSVIIKEEEEDAQFQKKYINNEPQQIIPPEITSISSVQYENQDQKAPVKIPNSSFQVKFIPSAQHSQNLINQNDQKDSSLMKESLKFVPEPEPQIKRQPEHVVEPIVKNEDGKVRQLKPCSILKQKNINAQVEKAPNQKIKIFSSNKRKSSNKSSPLISHEKQQSNTVVEVKTKEFALIENVKSKELTNDENKKIQGSPFVAIETVKETVATPPVQVNTPSVSGNVSAFSHTYNSNHSKPIEYPSYALPSTTREYKFGLNSQYSYATSNYISNTSQHEQEPSYGVKRQTNFTAITGYNTKDSIKIENQTNFKEENNVTRAERSHGLKVTLPSADTRNNERRSYLAELSLKQSINVDEPKKVEVKKEPQVTLLDRKLKQSLKQSINLGGSGQFDFNF